MSFIDFWCRACRRSSRLHFMLYSSVVPDQTHKALAWHGRTNRLLAGIADERRLGVVARPVARHSHVRVHVAEIADATPAVNHALVVHETTLAVKKLLEVDRGQRISRVTEPLNRTALLDVLVNRLEHLLVSRCLG